MNEIKVADLVERLKKEHDTENIKRFSKNDFRDLVFAVLSDKDFKAKKYLFKNDEFVENEISYNDAMRKFMDKLLKHAGISDSTERSNVLDTFEYNSKDTEWICDAVDEAMHIYTECGKSMRMFRDKMYILTVSKIERTGKYEGRISYKKTVIDRAARVNRNRSKALKK